ncbi:UTRA domain-containing protein [Actinosynnema pretiosum]|uniref:UTRA domain-containing protein n=1 Tax=Actinosynnema pretiosum TaxID=42197 RepID=UPI0022B7565C|nr:UTRA domain-containing protein [Actinosynnema pretiosum]
MRILRSGPGWSGWLACDLEGYSGAQSARLPSDLRAASRLPPRLQPGEPVMILTRRTFAKDGTPIEFARGVHAASRFEWSYSFQIPD